jgi:hypothetical protein
VPKSFAPQLQGQSTQLCKNTTFVSEITLTFRKQATDAKIAAR